MRRTSFARPYLHFLATVTAPRPRAHPQPPSSPNCARPRLARSGGPFPGAPALSRKVQAACVPSQKVVRNRDRARAAQSVRGRVQRTYSARNVCRCFCASGAPNMKAPPPSPSTAPFHLNIHLLARFWPWGPPRPRRASDAPRLIFSCPNFPPFRGGEGRAPAQAPPPPRPLPESSLQRWASRRPSPRRGRVPPPCVYPGHRPPRRRAETCTADDFSWWPRHRPRTFLRGPHRPQCRRSRVVVRRNASFAMHRPRANLIVIGASPLASLSPPRR